MQQDPCSKWRQTNELCLKRGGWMETQFLFPSSSGTYCRSSTRCVFRSYNLLAVMYVGLIILIIRETAGVQVTGGNITVVQGGTIILPCKLTDTVESLTQISWQRRTREKPQNNNFFIIPAKNGPRFVDGQDNRFQFVGSVSDFNGSLQISRVTLMDEGVYTCIFTLFPSGNYKAEITLNLLVPPVTSLKDNCPVLGNVEASLVTCTAAGYRPSAEVMWQTGTLKEKVRTATNSTQHANGTTTTDSSLFGVPTREISQHQVQCVITSVALQKEETLPFTIQVYFSPREVTISHKSDDSFQCLSEANPPANFTWSRADGLWPKSAVAEGATLHFSSMTSDLNGEYQCEASNQYGRKYSYLYLHVPSGHCSACWTLFSILLFLIVFGAAAVWYRRTKYRGSETVSAGPIEEIRELAETT
ncbi:nectin-4 [Scomber scombrus]